MHDVYLRYLLDGLADIAKSTLDESQRHGASRNSSDISVSDVTFCVLQKAMCFQDRKRNLETFILMEFSNLLSKKKLSIFSLPHVKNRKNPSDILFSNLATSK